TVQVTGNVLLYSNRHVHSVTRHQRDTCTHTHTHTHTHVQIHTCTCTCINRHTQTHMYTHPPKKLQSFIVHSESRVLHSSGRQRAQHTLLALLSLHSAMEQSDAPSANNKSGLSSEPAQQDGPGGHTHPHHNFHSPLVSR
ncbi:unnamed protein product, partial [Staurois parvus]